MEILGLVTPPDKRKSKMEILGLTLMSIQLVTYTLIAVCCLKYLLK